MEEKGEIYNIIISVHSTIWKKKGEIEQYYNICLWYYNICLWYYMDEVDNIDNVDSWKK